VEDGARGGLGVGGWADADGSCLDDLEGDGHFDGWVVW
jgi:hypothetical protein